MRFEIILRLVYFIFQFGSTWPAIEEHSTSRVERSKQSTDYALRCGPNAFYMFLVLSGVPHVKYEKLTEISKAEHGMSLFDMRKAAKEYGLNTEIRQYDLDDIASLPLPAIMVFHSARNAPLPFHFGVLYKVDAQRIYFIDGTTGQKNWHFRSSRLFNWWTGVAMTERKPLLAHLLQPWGLLCAAIAINAMYFVLFFRRKAIPNRYILHG